ncbi:MAG: glycosyltransferase [Planctomycetes bacterium]|nr:glycosyltransferase [Planctomycetota bacterium]
MTTPQVRTCFFGVPAMGSWKIRAGQVAGVRREWHSTGSLEPYDIVHHDAFVAVKRPFRSALRLLTAMGKTTIYDVVDCWAQPADGLRYRDLPAIRGWFREFVRDLAVDGVIFPNRTMREDLGDLVPNPTTIYHHYWPGMAPIEVREQARLVGYQGEPEYLGQWRAVIERICARHGLRFVVNPSDYRNLDIGFAARGGVHASTLAHRYKSNVKLANFYGAALPCVVNDSELAYKETDNGQVRFFATERELEDRIVELLPYETRLEAHRSFLDERHKYTLEAIGDQYDAFLRTCHERRELAPTGRYPAAP